MPSSFLALLALALTASHTASRPFKMPGMKAIGGAHFSSGAETSEAGANRRAPDVGLAHSSSSSSLASSTHDSLSYSHHYESGYDADGHISRSESASSGWSEPATSSGELSSFRRNLPPIRVTAPLSRSSSERSLSDTSPSFYYALNHPRPRVPRAPHASPEGPWQQAWNEGHQRPQVPAAAEFDRLSLGSPDGRIDRTPARSRRISDVELRSLGGMHPLNHHHHRQGSWPIGESSSSRGTSGTESP